MLALWLALWAAVSLIAASPARAGSFDMGGEERSELPFKLSGLLDVRYARTSISRSWLQGGPSRLRHGGADKDGNGSGDRAADVLSVPQASLVFEASGPAQTEAHVQLNVAADTESGNASAGLIEAFGRTERRAGPWAAGVRAGALIPPISLEHPGTAWSTRWTVTPSAIGSWIGEEIRAFGAEAQGVYSGREHSVKLIAAAFGGNDVAGRVLGDRGWALHDYQADVQATLPLPGGRSETPFKEIDGRAGFYGRLHLSLWRDLLRLGGGYWDNNAELGARSLSGASPVAAWSTQFYDGGGRLEWRRLVLIGQFLKGRTAAATFTRRGYQACYGLAALRLGRWTLSGRFDDFKVYGLEDGYAATGALQFDCTLRQRLSLEYVQAYGRLSRAGLPASRRDEIAQANYRLRWGG